MELNKLEWACIVLLALASGCLLHVRKLNSQGLRPSRILFASYIFLVLFACLYTTFAYYEEQWYRKKLASVVPVGRAIVIDTRSGIREGCGAAVFELDSMLQDQILKKDIHQYSDKTSEKQAPSVLDHVMWDKTPFVTIGDGTDFRYKWLVGLSCARLSRGLNRVINTALLEPGSYTRNLGEAGVLVIPARGLVVFSFSG